MNLVTVAVGEAQEQYGLKYRVLPGREKGGEEGWTHSHTFMAYPAQMPGSVPLCIGMAWDSQSSWHKGQRYLVKWGMNASGNGWKHDGLIFVYGTPVPGTEPFSVGHAEPVWRYRIVPGMNAGGNGWTHDFTFWAYKFGNGRGGNNGHGGQHGGQHGGHHPGGADHHEKTVVSVGRFQADYGSKFCVVENDHDGSWDHVFKFKVWKNNQPGLSPISVGTSRQEGGWRYKLGNGRRGSVQGQGFHHTFTFFAHNFQSPGTVPITVSHADNPTRYRVNEGTTSSNEPGWTQDFTFYALPQ